MSVLCETVKVTVEDEDGNVTTVTIPAYTRAFNQMKEELDNLVSDYLQRSMNVANPMSVGDFALYAITVASKDPRRI